MAEVKGGHASKFITQSLGETAASAFGSQSCPGRIGVAC